MSLNFNIKLLRKEKKLTQQQLADLAGVERTLITKIEKRVTKDPSVTTIFKIARALEVTVEDLVL